MARTNTHHNTPWLLLAVSLAMVLVVNAKLPQSSLALSTNSSRSAGGGTLLGPVRCRPEQAAALLQLKRSFSFIQSSGCGGPSNTTTLLPPWRVGTDCCRWEGVGCDGVTGRVTAVSLRARCLTICGGLHPALFNLTSLQYLDLGENDFCGSQLPKSG
ncbi:unnamed protein product [Urochloa humidicola]